MQPHSFSKRQLAAIALMLDEEEKNAALDDKKKRMWVHKCFRNRKSEGEYWTLYKELADDEMKFYQYFRMSKHQFNHLLQKIEKDLKKKNTHLPRSNITCGEPSNLSTVSALQVNVIFLLKNIY
jgi:hypothetical protein